MACHQAGHAIVAWSLGLGVASAEMVRAEDWEEAVGAPPGCDLPTPDAPDLFGRVHILFRARDRWELTDPLPMLLFALGGPAAEIVHGHAEDVPLAALLASADPGDDLSVALDKARERVAGGELRADPPRGSRSGTGDLSGPKLELLERSAGAVLSACWSAVLAFLRAHEPQTAAITEELLRVRTVPGRELHRLCGAWNADRGRFESDVSFDPYLPKLPKLARVRRSLAEFVSPLATRSTRPPKRDD